MVLPLSDDKTLQPLDLSISPDTVFLQSFVWMVGNGEIDLLTDGKIGDQMNSRQAKGCRKPRIVRYMMVPWQKVKLTAAYWVHNAVYLYLAVTPVAP